MAAHWSGGEDFSLFNQTQAAAANVQIVWSALRPLLVGSAEALARLGASREGFAAATQQGAAQPDCGNNLRTPPMDEQRAAHKDGVMIPVRTAKGEFRVWTRRVGNNPAIKVLLLHGGPGGTHECFEPFAQYLPAAGIEYVEYDQLGSYHSDQPDEPDLWELPRFVDEVEQVRQALGLDAENFVLYGHSWGGLLALEYALQHPQQLKGLIISNMMASIPAYNAYANTVIMPAMNQEALAEIQRLEAAGEVEDPRYMELLIEHHYREHVLRMPQDQWPDGVNRMFEHLNQPLYVAMQGPSELGAHGKLAGWNRMADLGRISTPTLVIGATHDTMDPGHMEWMAGQVQKGRYLHCPNGSHLALYDDQAIYMQGLISFLHDLAAGTV
jgi:proline iminopeptidase